MGETMYELKEPSPEVSSWRTTSLSQQSNRTGFWKNAYRDLRYDLKNTNWLRGLGWFASVVWCLGLVGTSVVIGVKTLNETDGACLPDGSFRLHPEDYSLWSSSGYFQITLGGGRLSFTAAKVIDVAWDIVIGRGGQVILAFVSYRVFAKYITVCMETAPVNYQTFRTIFLQNDSSLPSTYGLIESFVGRRPLRSVTAMIFMIVTMIFLILWPTLASAMSGYDANVGSYIPDYNQNFVPFNNFSKLLYIVHDGGRINLSNDAHITDQDLGGSPIDPVIPMFSRCRELRSLDLTDEWCDLQYQISKYVKAHGLGGTKNTTSVYNESSPTEIKLPAPVLNISKFYVDDPNLGGFDSPNQLNQSWYRGTETYPLAYIEASGTCQNIGDYQWGFSFLQLFIAIELLWLWTVGIYIMWLRAHFMMIARHRDPRQTSGVNKAILELAAAMQKELDIQDVDPSMLNEKDLNERIDKELKGGGITYFSAYPEADRHSFRRGIRDWLEKNKWWSLALICTTVLAVALLLTVGRAGDIPGLFFGSLSAGGWVGIVAALCLGTTTGSRTLILLFCSILCTPAAFFPQVLLLGGGGRAYY